MPVFPREAGDALCPRKASSLGWKGQSVLAVEVCWSRRLCSGHGFALLGEVGVRTPRDCFAVTQLPRDRAASGGVSWGNADRGF